jgi:hypothetical protein
MTNQSVMLVICLPNYLSFFKNTFKINLIYIIIIYQNYILLIFEHQDFSITLY